MATRGKLIDFKLKGKKVKIDDNIAANLDEVKEMIKLSFDGVGLYDGMEGSGKSEIAMQHCLYVDPSFSHEDVFYTAEQFEDWVETAKPGKAGCWDEFVLAGLSTDALSKIQNIIIKKFTMIRKKRLFIALVIPYIFMLRKYFAVARTRFLVHTYSVGKQRGFFKFYSYSQKLYIYNYGYKTWIYSPKVIPAFQGVFKLWSQEFIDDNQVQLKKDEAIKSVGEEVDAFKLTPKLSEKIIRGGCLTNTYDQKENPTDYRAINKILAYLKNFEAQ